MIFKSSQWDLRGSLETRPELTLRVGSAVSALVGRAAEGYLDTRQSSHFYQFPASVAGNLLDLLYFVVPSDQFPAQIAFLYLDIISK